MAKDAELNGLKQSLFMGSTLRGLLLNAYAFGTMGVIAGIASIGASIGAIGFLGFLGLRHAKQVDGERITVRTREKVNA